MINVSVDYISYGTVGSVPVSDMDCLGRGRRRCMAFVYSCMLVDLCTVHVAALLSGDPISVIPISMTSVLLATISKDGGLRICSETQQPNKN